MQFFLRLVLTLGLGLGTVGILHGRDLGSRASASPAVPVSSRSFTPAEQSAIGEVVRSYLLAHPEVLEEVAHALEAKRQTTEDQARTQALQENADRIVTPGVTPVLGNPAGDVTVVMFSDYACGYCQAMVTILEQLVRDDAGVRVVIKELPILGPNSLQAARMALAAVKQDLYPAFHKALFQREGDMAEASLEAIARAVGLDLARLATDQEGEDIRKELVAIQELAQSLAIRGTPAFIVGNRVLATALPLAKLKQAVAEARSARSTQKGKSVPVR